jgi:eukaryotic-like serine/threonine-protein kinase
MPTSLCLDPAQLTQFCDGGLPKPEQTALIRHLEQCPPCRAALDNLSAGNSWEDIARQLRKELQTKSDEPGLQRILKSQLSQTRPSVAEKTPCDTGATETLEEDWRKCLSPSTRPGAVGRLAHYDVLQLLGRGGMGVVLKAFDEKLQREVAIKLLAPALCGSDTARKRFVREARAAAAVRDGSVVAIYDVEETGPYAFLVMEFIAGISLDERIKDKGPLELKEILKIGMQSAEGLAAAHKQGLVHRDIKPGNILLESDAQRVKITDFGLARATDDISLTQSGVIAGTPTYMAPEQARGETVDHRADLFSLGTVLYAMCTGNSPFRASGSYAVLRRVCEEEPRPISEINPNIPDWLCAIISKLHAKDPAERFQSAKSVANRLRQHLLHLQSPNKVPAPKSLSLKRNAPASVPRLGPVELTPKVIYAALAVIGVLIVAPWAFLLFSPKSPAEGPPPAAPAVVPAEKPATATVTKDAPPSSETKKADGSEKKDSPPQKASPPPEKASPPPPDSGATPDKKAPDPAKAMLPKERSF